MALEIRSFSPVSDQQELKRFVDLPWQIYRGSASWVPPLRLQILDDLDVKKNPFYQHAEIQLFNAYENGRHLGRIAAIDDARHNQFHEENLGFFGFFESIDRSDVSAALFRAAEAWLRARGREACRGPANPSLNHTCGLQISHFNDSPFIMMPCNHAYYSQHLEQQGYAKIKDLVCFEVFADRPFPPLMVKLAERVNRRNRVTYRSINMKDFPAEVKRIREIYNVAWEKNWGFVPMDDAEFDHLAKGLKDVIWPEMCLVAEVDGEAIGFSITLPDLNQVLKRIPSGRLLPTGIFKLLYGLRPKAGWIDRARVITLGVRPEYRTSGVANVLFYETYRRAPSQGIKMGEVSWVLEDNLNMVNAAQLMAGTSEPSKRYRLYQKSLVTH